MSAYTNIPNALVQVGAKPFASTVQALRDNTLAIAEKDLTVPVGLQLGTWLLGSRATTSGNVQTFSGLNLTSFEFLVIELDSIELNGNDLPSIGSFVISPSGIDEISGLYVISLRSGVCYTLTSLGFLNEIGASGITNASTSVSLSLSIRTFVSGTFRLWGQR